jgi:hypothetical protein
MDAIFSLGLLTQKAISFGAWQPLKHDFTFYPGSTEQTSSGRYTGLSLLPTLTTGKSGFASFLLYTKTPLVNIRTLPCYGTTTCRSESI